MRKGLLAACVISLVLTGCGTAGKEITQTKETLKKETVNMYISEKEIIHSSQEGMWWAHAQAMEDTVYYTVHKTKNGDAGLYKKVADEAPVKVLDMKNSITGEFAVDPDGNIYVIPYENGIYYLKKYNANGEELFCKKAEGAGRYLREKGKLIGGIPVASEEGFCILSTRGVCLIWDAQGKAVAQVEMDWYKPDMQSAGGDFGIVKGSEAIYVYHREENSVFLQAVDFGTGTLKETEEIKLPETSRPGWSYGNDMYSGYEDGIYIADYEALYLYNDKTGQLAELFQWIQPGINLTQSDLMAIGKDENNKRLFYEYNFQTEESAKITVGEEQTTRYLLTLGYVDDGFRIMGGEYVTEFNRTQDDILITYKEYADLESLQQDLAEGTGPDLLELSGIDIVEYAEKGFLEGLDSYLKSGDGLNKKNILPSMLEAMSVNDEVYFLAPSFMIWTMMLGKEEAAKGGLTTTEFLTLETGDGNYLCDWSEDTLFNILLGRDIGEYIDWQKRVCRFDDGRFAAFLENVKAANLPEDTTTDYLYKEMEQGKYLAAFRGVNTLQSVKELYKSMGDITMITGWPDSEGNLEYDLSFSYGMLGINSASSKKDIAWEYLEYHLQAYAENCQQYSDSLSVLTDTFEEQLYQKASSKYSYITTNPYTGAKGPIRFYYTEEDRDLVRNMVENVKMSVMVRDMGTVGSIICEEVEAFFSDESSAKEVAAAIQERVSAYMKE